MHGDGSNLQDGFFVDATAVGGIASSADIRCATTASTIYWEVLPTILLDHSRDFHQAIAGCNCMKCCQKLLDKGFPDL